MEAYEDQVDKLIDQLDRGVITYKHFIHEIGRLSIELQKKEWEEAHQ